MSILRTNVSGFILVRHRERGSRKMARNVRRNLQILRHVNGRCLPFGTWVHRGNKLTFKKITNFVTSHLKIVLNNSDCLDKSQEYEGLHPWLGSGLLTTPGRFLNMIQRRCDWLFTYIDQVVSGGKGGVCWRHHFILTFWNRLSARSTNKVQFCVPKLMNCATRKTRLR